MQSTRWPNCTRKVVGRQFTAELKQSVFHVLQLVSRTLSVVVEHLYRV
jgi:hypothetical protein